MLWRWDSSDSKILLREQHAKQLEVCRANVDDADEITQGPVDSYKV